MEETELQRRKVEIQRKWMNTGLDLIETNRIVADCLYLLDEAELEVRRQRGEIEQKDRDIERLRAIEKAVSVEYRPLQSDIARQIEAGGTPPFER